MKNDQEEIDYSSVDDKLTTQLTGIKLHKICVDSYLDPLQVDHLQVKLQMWDDACIAMCYPVSVSVVNASGQILAESPEALRDLLSRCVPKEEEEWVKKGVWIHGANCCAKISAISSKVNENHPTTSRSSSTGERPMHFSGSARVQVQWELSIDGHAREVITINLSARNSCGIPGIPGNNASCGSPLPLTFGLLPLTPAERSAVRNVGSADRRI
ncbi:hypothetical protein B484DRAFT_230262 [Ochromonadaceae sp. CCMP2298]|nr:hypothetical protein B484DRAFT_230262 [Ochromonadaceae sp. CCMP2298]